MKSKDETDWAALGLVGDSEPMKRVKAWVEEVGPLDGHALVTGETGTGKTNVARALHAVSTRRSHDFVEAMVKANDSTFFRTELFGHTRDAFTGASTAKDGKVKLAQSGTLFLDEIGDLDSASQLLLLKFVQSKLYEPLGATKAVLADVRLVFATNKHLPMLVAERTFREDLWFRLSVHSIEMPPLRERMDDIRALAGHFMSRRPLLRGRSIQQAAWSKLEEHTWPGNVRELEVVLERTETSSGEIRPEHIRFDEAPAHRGGVRAPTPLLPSDAPSRLDGLLAVPSSALAVLVARATALLAALGRTDGSDLFHLAVQQAREPLKQLLTSHNVPARAHEVRMLAVALRDHLRRLPSSPAAGALWAARPAAERAWLCLALWASQKDSPAYRPLLEEARRVLQPASSPFAVSPISPTAGPYAAIVRHVAEQTERNLAEGRGGHFTLVGSRSALRGGVSDDIALALKWRVVRVDPSGVATRAGLVSLLIEQLGGEQGARLQDVIEQAMPAVVRIKLVDLLGTPSDVQAAWTSGSQAMVKAGYLVIERTPVPVQHLLNAYGARPVAGSPSTRMLPPPASSVEVGLAGWLDAKVSGREDAADLLETCGGDPDLLVGLICAEDGEQRRHKLHEFAWFVDADLPNCCRRALRDLAAERVPHGDCGNALVAGGILTGTKTTGFRFRSPAWPEAWRALDEVNANPVARNTQ